eukprot:16226-Heterococcus_DN1.PRE.5
MLPPLGACVGSSALTSFVTKSCNHTAMQCGTQHAHTTLVISNDAQQCHNSCTSTILQQHTTALQLLWYD